MATPVQVAAEDASGRPIAIRGTEQTLHSLQYRWNTETLATEVITTTSGSGTEVSITNTPAVTIADGSDAAQGATTDPDTSTTVIGLLKKLKSLLSSSVAVTGAFYPVTQPISAASLPLPTNAATDTLQTSGNASLTTIAAKDFATTAKQDVTNTALGLLSTAEGQSAANVLLTALGAKDFATSANQDTAQDSLDALVDEDFATSAKQDEVIPHLTLRNTIAIQALRLQAAQPTNGFMPLEIPSFLGV